MHGDHIGGMMKDGEKSFPNATVRTSTREYSHWSKAGGSAKDVLTAYSGKLALYLPEEIGSGKEIEPGITPVTAYGHTPGHTGFLIESEGQKLLIWGDIAHAMAIQMPFPQVAVTYDSNPDSAILYRRQLLEYAAKNNIPVAGMHIPYPGMGRVSPDGNSGYRLELNNR
jgi:glyoxylase-like metal-dependent hydrolase (beta-lactamase superfamily II)